jgi:hypothetical protein
MWHALGRRGMHTGFWWVSHYGDLDGDDRKILKWLLEKEDVVMRTGLIWLKIRTTGGLV